MWILGPFTETKPVWIFCWKTVTKQSTSPVNQAAVHSQPEQPSFLCVVSNLRCVFAQCWWWAVTGGQLCVQRGGGGKTGKVCFDGRGERDGRRSLFKEALCGPDFLRLNVSALIPVRSSSLLFFLGGNSPRKTKHSLSALKAQLLWEMCGMTSAGWDLFFLFLFFFCWVASAVLVLEESVQVRHPVGSHSTCTLPLDEAFAPVTCRGGYCNSLIPTTKHQLQI